MKINKTVAFTFLVALAWLATVTTYAKQIQLELSKGKKSKAITFDGGSCGSSSSSGNE